MTEGNKHLCRICGNEYPGEGNDIAVLISTQPQWCEMIASGKKTVEVRKTKPKLQTPFKCYIYCTKNYSLGEFYTSQALFAEPCKGKVIGKFVCDKLIWVIAHPDVFAGHPLLYKQAIMDACLTEKEAEKFSNGKDLYGYHISDLVIYDKPKELSEFYVVDIQEVKKCKHRERIYNNPDYTNGALLPGGYLCHKGAPDWCTKCKTKQVFRPPQSWCYVKRVS